MSDDYKAPALLEKFIKAKSLTQAQAAFQIDIVPAALNGYIHRKQRPRSDVRQRIAKWSDGAVPESAWLNKEERQQLADTGVAETATDSDASAPTKKGRVA